MEVAGMGLLAEERGSKAQSRGRILLGTSERVKTAEVAKG